MLYKGKPMPVHADGIDPISRIDYWQFHFWESVVTCKLTLVEGTWEQVKWENKVGEEQAMCNPCHQEENKLEVQNRQQQQKYNTEKIQGH